jgi:hypothetical protein
MPVNACIRIASEAISQCTIFLSLSWGNENFDIPFDLGVAWIIGGNYFSSMGNSSKFSTSTCLVGRDHTIFICP